jgi:hypothetical protein
LNFERSTIGLLTPPTQSDLLRHDYTGCVGDLRRPAESLGLLWRRQQLNLDDEWHHVDVIAYMFRFVKFARTLELTHWLA